MTRLPLIQQSALDETQAELWHKIVDSRSGKSLAIVGQDGALVGPFNAMVFQPDAGRHWESLGALLRFNSTIDQRLVELAICVVGAHFRADFEFVAHRTLALKAGVSPAVIESVRQGEKPGFKRDDEAIIYGLVTRLLHSERIPSGEYERSVALLGVAGLGHLASVIGYYCWISVTLNLFEVAPPAGESSPWPDEASAG